MKSERYDVNFRIASSFVIEIFLNKILLNPSLRSKNLIVQKDS